MRNKRGTKYLNVTVSSVTANNLAAYSTSAVGVSTAIVVCFLSGSESDPGNR